MTPDPLTPEHCPGCRGWTEPGYLQREPCPGAALRAATPDPAEKWWRCRCHDTVLSKCPNRNLIHTATR